MRFNSGMKSFLLGVGLIITMLGLNLPILPQVFAGGTKEATTSQPSVRIKNDTQYTVDLHVESFSGGWCGTGMEMYEIQLQPREEKDLYAPFPNISVSAKRIVSVDGVETPCFNTNEKGFKEPLFIDEFNFDTDKKYKQNNGYNLSRLLP